MRIVTLILALVLMFSGSSFAAETPAWEELKGDHFIIYYLGDSAFPKDVLYESEKYYKLIANDLGYSRYSKFWQWDNRVKIYIYENQSDFTSMGNYPSWSEGIADYYNKSIYTYNGSDNFLNDVLPHEITHLIFRDFVGLENPNIPMWLDEGVAQWEEPYKRKVIRLAVKEIYNDNKVMVLKDFMAFNINRIEDKDRVRSYYIQAMGLVEFLMSEYGSSRFVGFCRDLRDGKGIEGALQSNYPTQIRSIEDLEEKWIKWMQEL